MGPRILTPHQRRLALGAAFLGGVLPVLIVAVDDRDGMPTTFFVGAVLAMLAPIGANLAPVNAWWVRWPSAYGGLVGLVLLQAHTGGVASPYAIFFVMGMVWFGLMASDRELVAGLVVMVGCCYLPMLVIGGQTYPVDVAHATALVLVNLSVSLGMAASTRQAARLTARLRHEANHDRLTGLLNRRGWDDVLDRPLGRGAVFALVDLDRLKEVNDELGHDGGDRVLRATANRLSERFAALGEGGVTVARLGGDEFAVLVRDRPVSDVVAVLDVVRRAATTDEGFSAGVAERIGEENPSESMRRADLALYEAKATGRHRTCVAGGPLQDTLETLPVDLH